MRVAVHDYAGHPFQVQLTRALAGRGHEATHFFFHNLPTPQGDLTVRAHDPPSFSVVPVQLDRPFAKNALIKRALQEREYGRRLADAVNAVRPDVLLTANTPNDVLDLLRARVSSRTRQIWWLQDVYSVGIRNVLGRRLPPLATALAWWYGRKEAAYAQVAERVVCITDDFHPLLRRLGVPECKLCTVPNWAPLHDLPCLPRDNAWRREHGLSGKTVVLYAGTLARKHNPALLVDAAAHLKATGRDDAVIVVVSEGPGAAFIAQEKQIRALDNLLLLPFQPFQRLAEMLSAADVLVAVIEAEAGRFSVPSKVLSYLCAGRPLLCVMPNANLAARTVCEAGAGIVLDPADAVRFPAMLTALLNDPERCSRYGAAARAYAERTFDIERIADRFEALCRGEPTRPPTSNTDDRTTSANMRADRDP